MASRSVHAPGSRSAARHCKTNYMLTGSVVNGEGHGNHDNVEAACLLVHCHIPSHGQPADVNQVSDGGSLDIPGTAAITLASSRSVLNHSRFSSSSNYRFICLKY
jgi:hypothetical protein